MRLMINGQYVDAEINLVEVGQLQRQGKDIPVYAYRATKTVNGRKRTKEFKTYAECAKYLAVEKEENHERTKHF